MTFRFDIAGPDDDAEIRALLARNPVPGRVVVSYEREPSYFLGCRTMGPFSQVVVARDEATGRLAAVACRTVRRRYVDGVERDVGYLGQLRVDEPFRGRWLVSRGFRYMAALDADGRASDYITSITREGEAARRLLVDLRRSHFPDFEPVDEVATLAVVAGRPRRPDPRVRLATASDAGDVAAFYSEEGPRRQYFPVWRRGEVADADVLVAVRGGRIAGALALWDQTSCKQAVVRGYSRALGRVRPLYNALMRARGRPGIPAVGERVRFLFASFVRVAGDDAETFRSLLDRARGEAAGRGVDYIMIGLSRREPLLGVAKRFAHVEYSSTLYRVGWKENGGRHERSDDRVPHVEVATL